MNKITFNSATEFHSFVMFAIKGGLAYTATEEMGVYTVIVTGF